MSYKMFQGRAATLFVGAAAITFATIAWTGVSAQAPQGQPPAGQGGGRAGAPPAPAAGQAPAAPAGQGGRGGRAGGAPAGPPPTAQSQQAIDLTGNWVAVVNEDWRWRMVTPPKGDYASVPLNPAGTAEADKWTPAQDGQCEAFGMAGLMRQPTRVRISWQDPQTLKIETDNGQQTRLLYFDPAAPKPSAPSLQGFSVATWERPGGAGRGGRGAAPPPGGDLKAVTTMLRPGWLRKNGVPYSADAEVTEYFDRFTTPNGDEWFSVTTIVHDPKYLNQDFVTSSHFKKEADGSKWSPTPCKPSAS